VWKLEIEPVDGSKGGERGNLYRMLSEKKETQVSKRGERGSQAGIHGEDVDEKAPMAHGRRETFGGGLGRNLKSTYLSGT